MSEDIFYLEVSAERLNKILLGAILFNSSMNLSDAEKAVARKNIGAGSSDTGLTIKGYFQTAEELTANIKNPAAGDAYGVGLAYPYDIYIFDALNGVWINNGPIRGADGKDGEVTLESIVDALGYTPADADNLIIKPGSVTGEMLSLGAVGSPELAVAAVTREKLANDVKPLSYANKSVPAASWVADSTYSEAGFGYRATVVCSGVTENHMPLVIFDPETATSGDFAPVSKSGTNTVDIYAADIPEQTLIIPTIVCIPVS